MGRVKGIGGRLRSNLAIGRPRQAGLINCGLHYQTRDWLTRVKASSGSVPSYAVNAADQYANCLVPSGIWDNKIAHGIVILLATGQFSVAHIAFTAPTGITPTITGFTAANYGINTGLTGVANRFINLGGSPAQLGMTETNLQMSVYSRTNTNPGTFAAEMGCNSGTSPTETGELVLYARISGSHVMGAGSNISFSVTGATSTGLISHIIESSGVNRICQRGVQVGATNTVVMTGGSLQTRNIYAFCQNNFDSASEFSTRTLAYLYAGKGLTLQEEFAHHLAVQAMQGRLLRAV